MSGAAPLPLGPLPPGWAAAELRHVLRALVAGGTPTTDDDRYWTDEEVGTPWVAIADMSQVQTVEATKRRVTDAGRTAARLRLLPRGTLVYSMYASLGKVARLTTPAVTNQAILGLIEDRSKVDSRYLFWWLTYLEPFVCASAASNTQDNLNAASVRRLPCAVPPLPTQIAIANHVDAETARIDALIDRKQRFIDLLTEKRAALITHAVTKGLDPEVEMRESGVAWLGEVPAHWSVMALRRVVRRFVDYRGQTPTKTEDGVPLVTARNVADGRICFERSAEFVSEETYRHWMTRGFPAIGDVLITTEAPLGSVAQVDDPGVALAQRLILLKADPEVISADYLCIYIRSQAGQAELAHMATGSTAVGIKASHLRETRVTVPPLATQEMIVGQVRETTAYVERAIAKTRHSIDLLRELRTSLISAAVTGQLDIPADQEPSA